MSIFCLYCCHWCFSFTVNLRKSCVGPGEKHSIMASATGIPEQSFANEQEPLLGRPGDVSQGEEPIYKNLYIGTSGESTFVAIQKNGTGKQGIANINTPGTGVVAQFGVWIFAAIIWGAVFSHNLILFSAHPVSILFSLSASLILGARFTNQATAPQLNGYRAHIPRRSRPPTHLYALPKAHRNIYSRSRQRSRPRCPPRRPRRH